MAATRTDPNAVTGLDVSDDTPVQLRQWGTDEAHALPLPLRGEWMIGTAPDCWLRVDDPSLFASRRHALLAYDHHGWTIRDVRSKNGLWIDGERSTLAPLAPGMEIGVGGVRFVVETPRTIRLRAVLSRFLGWDRHPFVDRGMRALRDLARGHAPLWLAGGDDVIAVARRLHGEVFGDRPFVIADLDPRESLALAIERARDGTLCLPLFRMPGPAKVLRELADTEVRCRLILCSRADHRGGCPPIEVPPLATREADLPRLVDEYAADAIARLGARPSSYTMADRARLLEVPSHNLADLETTMLRLIALREYGGVTRAAPHLGLTHSALSRWFARRIAGRRARPRLS